MNEALVPGNVQTMERLIAQYGVGLIRMCYMLLHDRDLARDAAQESYLKVYRALDTLQEGDREKAWLMRIAINTCKDMKRSHWWQFVDRRVTLDDLPEGGKNDLHPDPTVLKAVMNLLDKYRQTIVLYYYQGMTLNEIAQTLNVMPATVRTRLMRARNRLRGQLEGWYYDE